MLGAYRLGYLLPLKLKLSDSVRGLVASPVVESQTLHSSSRLLATASRVPGTRARGAPPARMIAALSHCQCQSLCDHRYARTAQHNSS